MKKRVLRSLIAIALVNCFLCSVRANQKDVKTIDMKDKRTRQICTFIFITLKNTHELNIHRMNGATGNKVYIHKDGHKEAVYDKKGRLIEDCANKGSYNYHSVEKQPLMHFTVDMLPWMKWGNCPEDPTTKKQRAEAYLKDLRTGMMRALSDKKAIRDNKRISVKLDGQLQAMHIFMKILKNIKGHESYKYDGTDAWAKDKKKFDAFINALEISFKKALIKQPG